MAAPESASGSGSGLYTVVVDARLSGNMRGKSVVTVPFLTASLLLFSDMVGVVDSHAGVLGLNPGRPVISSLWNYFRKKEMYHLTL